MSPMSAARRILPLGLSLGAAAAVVVIASPSSAAALPAPTVSRTTVAAGENFTISGTGCVDPAPGAPLPGVAVSSTQLGDGAQAGADGSWSITTSFGTGTPAGAYTVRAVCMLSGGNQAYPGVSVTIPGPAAPTQPPAPAPKTAPAPKSSAVPGTARPSASRAAASTPASPTPAASTVPATTPPAPATGTALVAAPDCADCTTIDDGGSLAPGQQLTLRYTGFQPREPVTLVMHSTPLTVGTFTADASGVVTANFALPRAAEPGEHRFIFSGPSSGDREVQFELAAADSATAAAKTRGHSAWPLLLTVGVVGLLIVASVVIATVKWRRTAPVQPSATPASDGEGPSTQAAARRDDAPAASTSLFRG